MSHRCALGCMSSSARRRTWASLGQQAHDPGREEKHTPAGQENSRDIFRWGFLAHSSFYELL